MVFRRRHDSRAINSRSRTTAGRVVENRPRTSPRTSTGPAVIATELAIGASGAANVTVEHRSNIGTLPIATSLGRVTSAATLAAIIVIAKGIDTGRDGRIGHGRTTKSAGSDVAGISATGAVGVGLERRANVVGDQTGGWADAAVDGAGGRRSVASAFATASGEIIEDGRANAVATERVRDGTANRAIHTIRTAILRIVLSILAAELARGSSNGEADDGTAVSAGKTTVFAVVAVGVGTDGDAGEVPVASQAWTTEVRSGNVGATAVGIASATRVLSAQVETLTRAERIGAARGGTGAHGTAGAAGRVGGEVQALRKSGGHGKSVGAAVEGGDAETLVKVLLAAGGRTTAAVLRRAPFHAETVAAVKRLALLSAEDAAIVTAAAAVVVGIELDARVVATGALDAVIGDGAHVAARAAVLVIADGHALTSATGLRSGTGVSANSASAALTLQVDASESRNGIGRAATEIGGTVGEVERQTRAAASVAVRVGSGAAHVSRTALASIRTHVAASVTVIGAIAHVDAGSFATLLGASANVATSTAILRAIGRHALVTREAIGRILATAETGCALIEGIRTRVVVAQSGAERILRGGRATGNVDVLLRPLLVVQVGGTVATPRATAIIMTDVLVTAQEGFVGLHDALVVPDLHGLEGGGVEREAEVARLITGRSGCTGQKVGVLSGSRSKVEASKVTCCGCCLFLSEPKRCSTEGGGRRRVALAVPKPIVGTSSDFVVGGTNVFSIDIKEIEGITIEITLGRSRNN